MTAPISALTRRKLKILLSTTAIAALLVGGAYVGWKVRKQMMVRTALSAGRAAYDCGDWDMARRMLGRYLSVHPEDTDVLAKYAHAQLSVRPLSQDAVRQAMNAYRLVLRAKPEDEPAFRRLSLLYEMTGNFGELEYIAGKRLEVLPADPIASLARARSWLYREKPDAARAELAGLVGRLTAGPAPSPASVEACVLLGTLAVQGVTPGGDADRETEALAWLARALEYSPDSALAHVQRAALVRDFAERARRPLTESESASIRADLEAASKSDALEPRVRLALSEEWLAQRAYDRAAPLLAAAEEIDPESLTEYYIDPGDWRAALFAQHAKLALLSGAQEQGAQLARAALERLQDRPQRKLILPMAVELFVAAGQMSEAHRALDEFLETAKTMRTTAALEEQSAFLQAVVAAAEHDPYRVIKLLEPLADRSTTRRLLRGMLAEAYARTGQTGRAASALTRGGAETQATPATARQLARLHLSRGAWTEARAALASIAEADRDADTAVLDVAARLGAAAQQPIPARASALRALADESAQLRDAHPERADLRILLASIAEQEQQVDVAEAELRRALAECPDPLPVHLALSRLHADAGNLDAALADLRAACAQFGTQALPWLALGDLLVSHARIDEARATLHDGAQAVQSPEDQRRVALALAYLELQHGDPAAGAVALQARASEDPQDVEARALLLDLPQTLAEPARAQQLVEDLKSIEGESGLQWRFHQARLWLATPRWHAHQKEIVDLLRYCVEADPTRAAPILLLGRSYEQSGDLPAAEAVYASGYRTTGAPETADRLLTLLARQKRYSEVRDLLAQLKPQIDERLLGTWRVALAVGEARFGEAIDELELRLAGPARDSQDLIRLAGLTYAQTHAVDQALAYLDEATAAGAAAVDVARLRVEILAREQRHDDAERVLAELVNAQPVPESYLLRAAYHVRVARPDLAEQDYIALAQSTPDASGPALLGEFYAQTQRLDQAIATWLAGLERYPDATQFKRGLAKALLVRRQAGDRESAGQLLAELRAALPDDAEVLWMQARYLIDGHTPAQLAEARAVIGQALDSAPANAETYRGLGESALQVGEFAAARELAQRGTRLAPEDAALWCVRARAALLLGDLDAAGSAARTAAHLAPESPDTLSVLTEVAAQRGDTAALNAALTTIQPLLRQNPDQEVWPLLAARAQTALQQPDAASATLEAFCATDAGCQSVPAHLCLYDLYRARHAAADAQRVLDVVATLAPDQPAVLRARLETAAAARRFDDLVTLTAAHPQPELLLLAASLLSASPAHVAAARELCQRAAELAPGDVRPNLSLGNLAYAQGDVERAVQAYRAALQIQPAQPDALNNLAWILAERRAAYDEALAYARQAVAARPHEANFRDTLGFILRHLPGKLEEARAEYRRSVELAPADSALRARSLFHLAQVCSALHDQPALTQHLQEALAIEGRTPVFTPAERAEIERLLHTTPDAGRVSAAEPR